MLKGNMVNLIMVIITMVKLFIIAELLMVRLTIIKLIWPKK